MDEILPVARDDSQQVECESDDVAVDIQALPPIERVRKTLDYLLPVSDYEALSIQRHLKTLDHWKPWSGTDAEKAADTFFQENREVSESPIQFVRRMFREGTDPWDRYVQENFPDHEFSHLQYGIPNELQLALDTIREFNRRFEILA